MGKLWGESWGHSAENLGDQQLSTWNKGVFSYREVSPRLKVSVVRSGTIQGLLPPHLLNTVLKALASATRARKGDRRCKFGKEQVKHLYV